MNRILIYFLLIVLPVGLNAQGFNTLGSNISNSGSTGGFGSGEVFNPFHHQRDTTKSGDIVVPMDIRQWHIDELMGNQIPVNADTLQHLYQNWHMSEGMNGEYNYLGNMGTPRQSRIFFNRPSDTKYDFMLPFDYFFTRPGEFFFMDTKSPYTNISYNESGDKVTGDDRVRVYFASNAGKKFGIGFLFDYLYGRGQYDNQSTAYMNFSLFSYYKSDKYNYHLLASRYHMKLTENGGIVNDEYITNPENTDGSSSNFGTTDIPVHFDRTWNRNELYTGYFTHNYNFGFYRQVAKDLSGDSLTSEITRLITEREKGQQFTASDSTIVAELTDSIDAKIKREEKSDNTEYERRFINVARITHTADFTTNRHEFINYDPPTDYYASNFLRYDSINKINYFGIKNTLALSLSEGFSKWAVANITAYASYDYNKYTIPDTTSNGLEYRGKYNEHTLAVGGIIESNRSKYFKYKLRGETAISGEDLGAFLIEGSGEANFRLLKQDVQFKANAFIKNNRPSFFYRHFHSEHYWWDKNNLDKEFRTRIGGEFSIKKWRTKLKVGVENIKNYTYLANNSILNKSGNGYLSKISVAQESDNIQVLSATLNQDFKLGIFHLDTELTYQKTSNNNVLPLPDLNAYANFYMKFKIAKVLNTELGADVRYFTSYYANDYSPELGQFCQQNPADKIEIGNYPVVNVYANFLLKQTRFYVMYYHVNEGTGKMNYFLAPHYPLAPGTLWLGLSWNFYN